MSSATRPPFGNPAMVPASTRGSRRHILVIDRDNAKLYELFAAYPQGGGWHAGSGAVYDLNSNTLRPAGWTSADAAAALEAPGGGVRDGHARLPTFRATYSPW